VGGLVPSGGCKRVLATLGFDLQELVEKPAWLAFEMMPGSVQLSVGSVN
jgi:hypothetical protein